MVFFREPWYLWRNKYLFSYEIPEFQILESEFWFSDSPDIRIQKKIQPESLESKTESEFCLQWGSQKLEPKIGIPNLAQDYEEQIPDGMSWQTIHNSTVDTEWTIDVRNLVANIRKSKIMKLL